VTPRAVLREAGPRLLRDALGPSLSFYVGWKVAGLLLGVVLGTAFALAAYRYEKRHGRPGAVARFVLALVVVQAVIGVATHSAKAYLIQPSVLGALNGLAWIGSVAIHRPLAGVFAREVFPFDDETRASAEFRSVFTRVSLAWGTFFLVFALIQLGVLLTVGVDAFVVVRVIDAVGILAMLVWSVRHVVARLGPLESVSEPTTLAVEPG
jgi:intracellular septation protein A